MHYVGLDLHKKTISYCVKAVDGTILQEGTVEASRAALEDWQKQLPQPWTAAMEATLFTGWVYDHLLPYAQELKVAHPLMMRAIAAAKKKNDRLDAQKICDLLRCNLLPECYMAPTKTRELRRILRYRNLLVRQAVQMKNKISGLLMETGTAHNKQKLHSRAYFQQLLHELEQVPDSVVQLLKLSRGTLNTLLQMERQLLKGLLTEKDLLHRVERLMTIPGVGPITALTWALEIGEVNRSGNAGCSNQ